MDEGSAIQLAIACTATFHHHHSLNHSLTYTHTHTTREKQNYSSIMETVRVLFPERQRLAVCLTDPGALATADHGIPKSLVRHAAGQI